MDNERQEPIDPVPLRDSITEIRELSQRGGLSDREILLACYKQIKDMNPQLNAFIAIAPYDSIDYEPSGLLQAIPIAIKDMIHVSGFRTTCGSPKFFGKKIHRQDAHCIRRIRKAGGIILGKTNTHEIALGVTGVNPHCGAVRNPHDPKRISGGSSSGSAVAVAAGMVLAALGTDTGGSLRIPAALCGVVALKPSRGLISLHGVVPLSRNLDHVGPITRSVKDAALLLQVLAGYDRADPYSLHFPKEDYLEGIDHGVEGWRVAIAAGEYFVESEPSVVQGLHESISIFQSLGANLKYVEMSWLGDLAKANSVITQADAAAYHGRRYQQHPEWFGEDVRRRLAAGMATTLQDYIKGRHIQSLGHHRLKVLFQKYDLILLPTVPLTAPILDEIDAIYASKVLTRYTSPFNLTGLPAISLPCKIKQPGLPVGLQMVGWTGSEKKLLRAAFSYEQATRI